MNGKTRDEVVKEITKRLANLGELFGFSEIAIQSRPYCTDVYVYGKMALQLEFDWRENDLYMYIVRLNKGQFPSEDIIYRYKDGSLCRRYVEDVCNMKRPTITNKKLRYTLDYFYFLIDFYEQVILENKKLLYETLNNC